MNNILLVKIECADVRADESLRKALVIAKALDFKRPNFDINWEIFGWSIEITEKEENNHG